jgi:hypothetical protein
MQQAADMGAELGLSWERVHVTAAECHPGKGGSHMYHVTAQMQAATAVDALYVVLLKQLLRIVGTGQQEMQQQQRCRGSAGSDSCKQRETRATVLQQTVWKATASVQQQTA